MSIGPRTYWAAEPDLRQFADDLKARRMTFTGQAQTTQEQEMWRRAASLFWGSDPDTWRVSAAVVMGGNQGEIVNLRGNILRALIRQLHVMTTGSRPAFAARPVAYDAETTEIVSVANAWCDRILDDHVEEQLATAAIYAILFGEGWIAGTWDGGRGNVAGQDPMTGGILRTGEYRAQVFRPDQIIRDTDVDDNEHDWLCVLRQHSRWSLIQRFPQHERAILDCTEVHSTRIFRNAGIGVIGATPAENGHGTMFSDRIIVQEFYHRPTDALPEGRVSMLVGDTVIADGPNLYGEIPVYSMISSRQPGGNFGYGEARDLMGLQQFYDAVLTQIITTKENYGLRNVFVQPGSGIEPEMVGAGLRLLVGTSAPVSVDLEGDFVQQGQVALQLITGIMQMLTGLNDAALGDAGKSSSGAALVAMNQLAAQFNSGLQRGYGGLMEKTMTGALKCLRRFGTEEMTVHVMGTGRTGMVKRFMATDLDKVEGVKVELGNPAMRTVQGRIAAADQFLAQKTITPQQYLDCVATGRLEPVTDAHRAAETQVERENDAMLNGRPVRAAVTDFHAVHIEQHSILGLDPAVRDNEPVFAALLAHIQEHAQLWASASMDPIGVTLLAATGQQPSPAAAMLQAQAAAAMGAQMPPPDGEQAPPGMPENPPVPAPNAPPTGQGAPQMPRMPQGFDETIQ